MGKRRDRGTWSTAGSHGSTWIHWGLGSLTAVLALALLGDTCKPGQPEVLPPLSLAERVRDLATVVPPHRNLRGPGLSDRVYVAPEDLHEETSEESPTQSPLALHDPEWEPVHQALDHADPAVRLTGIQEAGRRGGEVAFELLSVAVLSDSEADNRLSAVSELEQLLRAGVVDFETILHLLEETATDLDSRVAALSQLLIQQQLNGGEGLSGPDASEVPPEDIEVSPSQERGRGESPEEPVEVVQAQALDDPDPSARLGGIEAAKEQAREDGLQLLSMAVRSEYEADNRLSAVSELEHMLRSRRGDRQEILQLLEETATDRDPRVAELSRLILREQRDVVEESEGNL